MTSPDSISTSSSSFPEANGSAESRSSRVWMEVAAILLIGGVWFFWGTGASEFVGTEALRAVVVKEMLQNDSWLVPTVHGRPYLRKPPLYAWTTSALATAVGRFDEQIARWPAGAMSMIFVLSMYFGARWLIDPRAGPAAAVLGAGNYLVLDFGIRAELDSGVLAMTAVAVLLLGYAWFNPGRARGWALVGCYAAALVGSFWKAPHVLLAVWFAALGMIWFERRDGRTNWRGVVFHPAQITGAILSVAIFILWFGVLSRVVGGSRAGSFVLFEFLARVVPHSLRYLVGVLGAIPEALYVTLPACLFALIWLHPVARANLNERQRRTFQFLLAWLIPNMIFLLFVPAKAPRYWFPIMGPVVLLGVMSWHWYTTRSCPGAVLPSFRGVIRFYLIAAAVVGAGFMVLGGMGLAGVTLAEAVPRYLGNGTLVATGAVLLILAALGHARLTKEQRVGLGLALAMMILAMKPAHVFVFLPVRSEQDSHKPTARQVDEVVPEGAPLFVLSEKPGSDRSGEMADLGYYCERTIEWPFDLEDAKARADGRAMYLILREDALERAEAEPSLHLEYLDVLGWSDRHVQLVRATPHAVSAPSTAAP